MQMRLLKAGAERLGVRVSLAQLERFQQYYRELVDWNTRVNLTSITGWEEVQTRHFLESLTVVAALPPDALEGSRALDLGSGAGLPGLPLKIVFPRLNLTLVDATAKKTAFLTHVAGVLGLADVDVLTGRAETLAHDPGLRESFDLVLARGVAPLRVLAELTLPFCSTNGAVVAYKKAAVDEEVREAKKAVETVGGVVRKVQEIDLPELGEPLSLVVLEKTGQCPDAYPRRPGIPKKRPL